MKNYRIVKTFAITAISALSLISGTSQAESWGHFERTYASNPYLQPETENPAFRGRFADNQHQAAFDIDARQQEQMEKIMHGLRSGSLSRNEAHKLMRDQKDIEQLQREYLSDHRLSRNEWIELDRLLDRAERDIRAEKHDRNWR